MNTSATALWQDCILFAQDHEVAWPRDPAADPAAWGVHGEDPPPYDRLRGPVHARGGVSGVALQHGVEVAAWGAPDRADLTFSVAKTYLCLLAGVAHGRGLLPDVDEPVVARLPGIGFDSGDNRLVTWRHLLEQTSEWEGTCFGLPDTVERWRKVAHDPRPAGGPKGGARPLHAPGSYWEYNDVRINQLSLALLHLFGQPLPEVFDEALMQPLGASRDWAWRPYDDAWIELQGRRVPSVPGGSHWGGGVSIGARDQALLGQLLLQDGLHAGRQLIPAAWVRAMRQPQASVPFYGWLTWLNPQQQFFAGASAASSFMLGAGGHYIWIEPAHDAVVVVRWLDSAASEDFMRRATAALAAGG